MLIGNELLSGKVSDENVGFLARELFARGIEVRRVLVVPDEVDQIVEALKDLRTRVDFVFTSGGIGPTHDDITVEAVSLALERPLERRQDLVERARKIFGADLNEAHLKMATVPRGVTLVESERTRWPAMVVDDVFILAGVPKILRRGYHAVSRLLPRNDALLVMTVIVGTDEWTLTPMLDTVVARFPDVQIGSYPVLGDGDGATFHVRLVFEGTNRERVEAAVDSLVELLPKEDLQHIDPSEGLR